MEIINRENIKSVGKKMIKVGSDFSGVGAFDQALMRLGIDYKTVFSCDMDLYARESYMANYGEPTYYPFDVYDRKIPKQSLDIYMTSPPCQAFSLAGKRKGESDKRGVLFYNSHEFIQENKPRFFIFENVKGLLSDNKKSPKDKIGQTFNSWITLLGGKSLNGQPVIFPHEESVPYHIYYTVLNAKHYGVPQNRERVFIVGIRDDSDNNFHWPKPFHLVKRLKDILEKDVDPKFYLSEKMITWITQHREKRESQNDFPMNEENISGCVTARYFKCGAEDPYVKVKSATKNGFEVAKEGDSINLSNLSNLSSETRRGRVGKEVAQTLDTACNQAVLMGAIRGRNPENPTSRDVGLTTEQRLELNLNGTSNALTTVQKDNVVVYDIPQVVKVRKYEVDIKGLQQELKAHKKVSNQKIADALKINKTTVDHWFRTDIGFSIPDPDIWFVLKGLLAIETTRFDKSITVFVEREGVYEKGNRVYGTNGVAPTMTSASADERILNNYQIRRLTPRECFRLMDFPDSFKMPCSNTQMYKQAGNSIVVNVLAEIINKLNINKL